MGAAGILRPDEVVFYHPLDDYVEHTQSQAWSGSGGFVAGKIGDGTSAVTADAFAFGGLHQTGAGNTFPKVMVALDSTRVFCGGKAASFVATVSGTDVTFGPSGAGCGFDNCPNDAILLSWDGTNGQVAHIARYYGDVELMTISGGGSAITQTRKYATDPSFSNGGSVARIDSTHFVIAFKVAGGNAFAAVCTVSGSDFTIGTHHDFPSGSDCHPDAAAALDSSRVVFIYRRGTNTARARVGTISGTDVTFGPEADIATDYRIYDWPAFTTGHATAVDSSTVVSFWPTTDNRGRARVLSVSGTDITLGSAVYFEGASGSSDISYLKSDHMGGGRVCISYRFYPSGGSLTGYAKTGSVSGTTLSFGARSEVASGSGGVAAMDAATCAAGDGSPELGVKVGQLDQAANMFASTPGAYPAAAGDDRVVVALWANKLGAGSSAVTVKRDYTVAFTASTIELGPATAVWGGAAIGTLMGTMSGGEHLLVADFEHTGAGNWNLRTSLDGAPFVDQGTQDSGSRTTSPASLDPGLEIEDGESGQWIDELVMWSGNKTSFDRFTSEELANLNDLADTFGEAMDQYESNYGAPICWQATAVLPDGTVWRDSGSGPCPAVIRVPRGAA